MLRQKNNKCLFGWVLVMLVLAMVPVSAVWAQSSLSPGIWDETETSRASWLMGRTAAADFALTGQRFEQSEIGGGNDQSLEFDTATSGTGTSGAWPILMSLVLPGAGEAYLGYKRGYAMVALDIFAWTQVAKYDSEGGEIREEYIAFADEHYSDELLVSGYFPGDYPIDSGYRRGQGALYFPSVGSISSVDELGALPLYVTKDDDFREYYENLGKWDQFIFGWDDYVRPDDYPGYTPTGDRNPDLLQPWVSRNREAYRIMRGESNDAYKKRDRWLYVNIGLRLFSVMQVAYLQGLLGGGPDSDLEIAGHTVGFSAVPMGVRSGAVSASVSF